MQDGVLIIDKPAGLSSAQVVGKVKKSLKARKVGHAGTLDPFATGVLVCLINKATRLAQFLLRGKKKYQAVLHLGVATDTQDPTGHVVESRPVPNFSEEYLQQIFRRYVGTVEQIPPAYSALKHKGVALYKLARRGRSIQKPARSVQIERLEIDRVALPEVHFTITCSAGTYVRTLCADIGQALGCGGHLSVLRRTKSSGFGIDEAMRLEALEHNAEGHQSPVTLIPLGAALRNMPVLRADRAVTAKITTGGKINVKDFTDLPHDATVMNNGEQGTFYKVIDRDTQLIAIVSVDWQNETIAYHGVFT
jgi:tRNA pseudouridine55 synthase